MKKTVLVRSCQRPSENSLAEYRERNGKKSNLPRTTTLYRLPPRSRSSAMPATLAEEMLTRSIDDKPTRRMGIGKTRKSIFRRSRFSASVTALVGDASM